MNSKQSKLIENFVRMEVRKELSESLKNRDLQYLYKLLKSYAKKIDAPLRNVVVNGNKEDPDFQKLLSIEKSWNDFIFGIDSYYQKHKNS